MDNSDILYQGMVKGLKIVLKGVSMVAVVERAGAIQNDKAIRVEALLTQAMGIMGLSGEEIQETLDEGIQSANNIVDETLKNIGRKLN